MTIKHLVFPSFLIFLAAGLFAPSISEARPVRRSYDRYDNLYTRRHFYMGGEAVGVAVLNQTGPRAYLSHGGGFNIFIGGRVHRMLAIEGGFQPTFHNRDANAFGHTVYQFGLTAFTFDLKVLPIEGPIQPYFTVGAGAYFLGDRLNFIAGGPGYQIGGGMDFWLTPHFSLGFKLQYRGVGLMDDNARYDNTYLSLFTGAFNMTGRF